MLANPVLWNFRHPITNLPKDSRIYLPEDGITEFVGPGYEDFRGFLIATVDPIDLIGLMMGRHTRKEFWKTDANVKEDEGLKAEGDAGDRQSDVEKTAELSTEVTEIMNEGDAEPVVDTERKTAKFETGVRTCYRFGASGVDPVLVSEQSRTVDTAGAVES
jgi:hypothetical protein